MPLELRILSPKTDETRGAIMIETPSIVVEGRINPRNGIVFAAIDRQPLSYRPDGYFKHRLDLQPGENRLDLVAYFRDRSFGSEQFKIHYSGDIEALVGKRQPYLFVIANEKYPNLNQNEPLKTPIADARDVTKELMQDFNFRNDIEVKGQKLSLYLENATREQIFGRLDDLRQTLTEDDRLLIYYAGHGEKRSEREAYWIPVDGLPGKQYTWIPSREVTDILKETPAKSILVVSDSCYSGAFNAGTREAQQQAFEQRNDDPKVYDKFLQTVASGKSRRVMSSGTNAPVDDGDGSGHSPFARRLIDGLKTYERKAFAASDLYHAKIHHQVTGNSERGQEPQFDPLEGSGHEGGDFVFVRAEKKPTGVPGNLQAESTVTSPPVTANQRPN